MPRHALWKSAVSRELQCSDGADAVGRRCVCGIRDQTNSQYFFFVTNKHLRNQPIKKMLTEFLLLLSLFLGLPWAVDSLVIMSLTKATLFFDFRHVSYAAGVHRIHMPPLLFTIDSVDPPSMTENKTAISFGCSFMGRPMRVRMFTSQPNESNLFFFSNRRAVYGIRMSLAPTHAFESHRLQMDVTLFEGGTVMKNAIPMMMFVESVEKKVKFTLIAFDCHNHLNSTARLRQGLPSLLHPVPSRRASWQRQQQRLLDHGRARDSRVYQ